MAGKIVKYGTRRERLNFSRIDEVIELPNLIEVQTSSFDEFINERIGDVFTGVFPIENQSKTLVLEYLNHRFDAPKYSIEESKDRDVSYTAPLRAMMKLTDRETGEQKEQEIFIGNIPMMTPNGTFIINGAERVIVSQLIRSPGVYFNEVVDSLKIKTYEGQVIPSRGTWLEYVVDSKKIAYVKIDRNRKMLLTTFLRALGVESDEALLRLFGESEILMNTLVKDTIHTSEEALIELHSKLRPGEPPSIENMREILYSRFYDERRYNLDRVGRYKFGKKISVHERLIGQVLAEDIIDAETGEIVAQKGQRVSGDVYTALDEALSKGIHLVQVELRGKGIEDYLALQKVHVEHPETGEKVAVIGTFDIPKDTFSLTTNDIIAATSYFLNLYEGIGKVDDIDHLGNRRVRLVGELLENQFKIGLGRVEKAVKDAMSTKDVLTPQTLINSKPIAAVIKEFFGSSQLSQFMDQTNPLAELTHKRRLSALGPGGLSRDRAGMEVRDVHYSHYGRICPIESPEGPNIGLINSLSAYARVNEYGFMETPYRKVANGYVTEEIHYLTATEEDSFVVGQSTLTLNEEGKMMDDEIPSRNRGANEFRPIDLIDYVEVSPKQVVSVATACIPFLENDDANRALMGSNMQRQSVPLLIPEAPLVGTGMEYYAGRDAGLAVVSETDGVIDYVDAKKIVVRKNGKKDALKTYDLQKFRRSNQGTSINQIPLVKIGDNVKKGEVLADGPSMENGELALGKNVLVAFMTWDGYNYEDAIIMNERIVKEDVYTSIHIEEYDVEARDTKLGPEEITADIPNISQDALKNLDEDGIIRIGAEVKGGDILVGKVSPKGAVELSPEEKLLFAIFGEKAQEVRDTSLRFPHGSEGIVHDVKVYEKVKGDELAVGVSKVVKVSIIEKRKIREGDKMAGRHGNKGVISRILPSEDMPYLPDGTPIDIMLNPLGVPSRMNIGQVLELHLGMSARTLGIHVATPVFDGATEEDVWEMLKRAGMSDTAKVPLRDGRTGELFDKEVSVGVMYMLKLTHMVDDKMHARSTGPYSLVTQQPLGGKAQFGGQRFGEMEVWALEAYGASHTLQEIITVKSDDVTGRVKAYDSIVKGRSIERPGVSESFRVLTKELQSLGLDARVLDDDGNPLDMYEGDDILSREHVQELDEKMVKEVFQSAETNDDLAITLDEDIFEQ